MLTHTSDFTTCSASLQAKVYVYSKKNPGNCKSVQTIWDSLMCKYSHSSCPILVNVSLVGYFQDCRSTTFLTIFMRPAPSEMLTRALFHQPYWSIYQPYSSYPMKETDTEKEGGLLLLMHPSKNASFLSVLLI